MAQQCLQISGSQNFSNSCAPPSSVYCIFALMVVTLCLQYGCLSSGHHVLMPASLAETEGQRLKVLSSEALSF